MFTLNSTDHDIYPAHKCYNANKIVSILTLMSGFNDFMHEHSFESGYLNIYV